MKFAKELERDAVPGESLSPQTPLSAPCICKASHDLFLALLGLQSWEEVYGGSAVVL